MIFVDANVPMYLIGAEHPHKTDAQRLVERLVSQRQRLVTDAEVFQELLHRYTFIRRREAIQPAFDTLKGIVDEVFGVEEADVFGAKTLVNDVPALSSRDALHISLMRRRNCTVILSFDRGFDQVPGIRRYAANELAP